MTWWSKMSDIVYSGLKTPDGTLLESRHVHDYVTHIDANGKEYMLDGGFEYVRCSANGDEELITVTLADDHETVREYVTWGTYGIDGGLPLKFVKLCNMSSDHIQACLDNVSSMYPQLRTAMENELDYRQKLLNQDEFKVEWPASEVAGP